MAFVSLGLPVNQAAAEDGGGDPLEGIVVKPLSNTETMYQPEPVPMWPVPDIFLSATMVASDAGSRKMSLAVVLNGVAGDPLGPLTLSIEGSAATLSLPGHPRVDTSGCIPNTTQLIPDQEEIVRRIAGATVVRTSYESRGVRLETVLTTDDLERFRRIIVLRDMPVLPPAAPPREDAASTPWPMPEGVSSPELIPSSKAKPKYPSKAKAEKKSGRVVLKARILKDGTIGSLRPVSVSAAGCGFEKVAMKAVRKWRYRPAMKNGEPVEVDFAIVVEFALVDPSGGPVAHLETRLRGPRRVDYDARFPRTD